MKQYLDYSRSAWYSFLIALPLLALYQIAAVLANLGSPRTVLNGADAILQSMLQAVGVHGWLGSWIVVAAIVGLLVYRRDAVHRKAPLRPGYLAAMIAESAAYALVFGTFVAFLTSLLLPRALFLQVGGGGLSWGQRLAASIGAGLYEELLFRLLLTGGLLWGFRAFGWSRGAAAGAAVVVSSFVFSLFHYIGPLADTFQVTSFAFRFVAGAVLAALFALRGFGIAAWTHALYDVFLLLAGKG